MPDLSLPLDWVALGVSYGVSVSPEHAALLDELASWLADRAFPVGLTNYRTADDIAVHALLPTLALFPLATSPLDGPILDLGAGSGALGLALAVLRPDLPLILADRRQRSATFMSLTRARLHLYNVDVRQVSAEDLAKSNGGEFQVACFRALAHAETALRLARPLLSPSGWVAVWHQSADESWLRPPEGWVRAGTQPTALPALSVSRLEIVSRETIRSLGSEVGT